MKIIRGSVKGCKDLTVPYNYIQNDKKPKTLAIFLPGAGYNTTSPLFHFTEEVYLNRGYDVLRVDYRYIDKEYDDFTAEELDRAVKMDATAVLDKFFSDHAYDEYYIAGKSLGTIAMAQELKKQRFENAKVIWLTPLIDQQAVLEAMIQSPHPALCFIGDQDRYYSQETYRKLAANPMLASKLYPGLNHSLEYGDNPVDSIRMLQNIITDIEQF